MPSSLFINHNPTEIITAYLYGCFIILENKKRAERCYTAEGYANAQACGP